MTNALTVTSLGTPRGNWDGYVGILFTVGAKDLVVSALGRWKKSGNFNTHDLIIQDTSYNVVARVTSDMTLGSAGGFVYTSLGSPVTLTAGQSYLLWCKEYFDFAGGDVWYDDDTTVTPSADITIVGTYFVSTESTPASSDQHIAGNYCYVPVDFQYTLPSTTNTAGNFFAIL